MVLITGPLEAFDTRNPQYYVRRGGFDIPPADWYANFESGGDVPRSPSYSDTTFVRGFDLTCGDFFEFRQRVALDLVNKGFIDIDFSTFKWRWETYTWHQELEQNAMMNRVAHVPAYWRHIMLREFVQATVRWYKKQQSDQQQQPAQPSIGVVNGALVNVSKAGSWKNFRKGYKYPHYTDLIQYQHLKVDLIYRLSGNISRVQTRVNILYEEDRPLTPEDRGSTGLSFRKLQAVMARFPHAHTEQEQELVRSMRAYSIPKDAAYSAAITNDLSLCNAVSMLREKNNDTIEIYCFGTGQEVPGQPAGRQGTRRRRDDGSDDEDAPRTPRKRKVRGFRHPL